jgi:hypothetical protein
LVWLTSWFLLLFGVFGQYLMVFIDENAIFVIESRGKNTHHNDIDVISLITGPAQRRTFLLAFLTFPFSLGQNNADVRIRFRIAPGVSKKIMCLPERTFWF